MQTLQSVPSDSDPRTTYDVTLLDGAPIACTCPDYTKRAKVYTVRARPCKHMRRLMPSSAPVPRADTVSVGGSSHYADTYDVVIDGVRYVGDVSSVGAVRLLSVEHPSEACDVPLRSVTDDALRAGIAALAEQARAMAERGEVDFFSVHSSRTWREEAQIALIHASGSNAQHARRELDRLKREESRRREDIEERVNAMRGEAA